MTGLVLRRPAFALNIFFARFGHRHHPYFETKRQPDADRGAVVKAYVVLSAGFAPSEDLVQELQHHVRGQLAPYEYPKDVEFIDALPMTTTGKVQRRVLRLQEEQRAGLRQA